MCQMSVERAITGQIKPTPVEAMLADADLTIVAARATQLFTIAIEKSLLIPDRNLRRQIVISDVCQCTKNTSWRKKSSEVWRSIFGST